MTKGGGKATDLSSMLPAGEAIDRLWIRVGLLSDTPKG